MALPAQPGLLEARPQRRRSSAVRCAVDGVHTKRLLRGVLGEALDAQNRKRVALAEQLEKATLTDAEGSAKARAKALRRAEQVPLRLAEVDAAEKSLAALLGDLDGAAGGDLERLVGEAEALGLAGRLESFDVDAARLGQWGRPDGFEGLVVETARGVPLLVARRAFSDAELRRVGRGSDLWFQVRTGRGSRVLLRTSLVPSLARSTRECMEMAADLAAYFSDERGDSLDGVEVMFTDSRHVAKRGGRVGQMKQSKRLGLIRARPSRVAELARGAQEEQGRLQ